VNFRIFFSLIVLFSLQNIFAQEFTERAIEVQVRGEYNRSSNYHGEMSVIGTIELDNLYQFRGGGSIGRTTRYTDVNTFISAKYSPFLTLPLSFSVSYIYNGLPANEVHSHSILPLISFNTERAGGSAGVNFRFTSPFSESPILEPILSFYGYYNFINMDTLHMGAAIGNFNEFHVNYLRELSLRFHILLYLGDNWTITNEIELMQRLFDGLNFYGFAWRGGVKYSW
jgi:hypothetical protein